jgi:hypothetical protein
MTKLLKAMTLGSGLLLVSVTSYAAAPANAPAGTTGLCNDGTFYSGATKQGACKGHKGVKDWYGSPAAAAPATTPAPAATPTPAKPPATAAAPAPAVPPATAPAASATPKVAAAGGGAGKVWVNKDTKVYHCPGDKWYGKTKEGEYMSEGDAKAQGFKPDHNKACK